MSKELKISSTLSLPIDAATQTIAIVARKRVGKTYTASVIAEEFIKAEIPIGEKGSYITVGNSEFTNRNDYWLHLIGREAGMIVAAWGAFPCAIERSKSVRGMFAGKLHHLGLTQDGHPKHPLYLKKETQPILWH